MYDRLSALPCTLVIKAAGNMAWPMGLRTERLAQEIRMPPPNTASLSNFSPASAPAP